MLGPYLDKGMESARRNVQAEPFLKQLGYFAIGSPAPPQFADQIAMRFQLGAWWLGRQIGKIGDELIAFQMGGGLLKNHD
jgi:hypothetical protein